MPTPLDFARELIEFDSVSSRSNVSVTDRVQAWLADWGFETERLGYTDADGVDKANVIGKLGTGQGGIAFFGHTDVVPADDWKFDEHGPFQPVVKDGKLFGRGSTDMKGPVACMLAAAHAVSQRALTAPVYLCCTADEEVGMLGAQQVASESRLFREIVDAQTRSIVGEPTQLRVVHGHKGGCGARIRARGRAAHSSTGEGINANWKLIPFLFEMKELNDELESAPQWRNDDFSPPTMTMNIVMGDTHPAVNITAPESNCGLYFRAMPNVSADPVIERIRSAAEKHGLEFEQSFRMRPFYVDPQSPFVQECLQLTGQERSETVAYGTDAAYFGDLQRCVILGPGNIAQAHTHDEWIRLADLESGTRMYSQLIERWCC